MNEIESIFKSITDKERNADKRKLPYNARAVYLAGIASLEKCEDFAKKGNKGRGFVMPTYAKTEVTA